MKKLIPVFLVAILLTGCAAETESGKDFSIQDSTKASSATRTSGTDESSTETEYDPFARGDSGNASGGTLGSFQAGVDWKDGKQFVLDYAPTISFDYYVKNDNTAADFGLLLFVNGISQPYRTSEDAESKTMHIFDVTQGEKKTQTIFFEAVTGEQGDTLSVETVSMFQPSHVQQTNENNPFQHKISSSYPSKLLVTEKTGQSAPTICTDYTAEQVTDELRQQFNTIGEHGGVGENALEKSTTIQALKNGVLITPTDQMQQSIQNELDSTPFQISDDVELCMYGGKTPCKYRVSMYVNHELVHGVFDGADYLDMTVSRDEICKKKVVLSALGLTLHEWNHFYFVAVPFYTNENYGERMVLKSQSVTLIG